MGQPSSPWPGLDACAGAGLVAHPMGQLTSALPVPLHYQVAVLSSTHFGHEALALDEIAKGLDYLLAPGSSDDAKEP